jgi:ferredoxin--NADP+ reductase
MVTIIKREQLSTQVVRMRVHAPRIAGKRKAGQFIILRPTADSERIPLTIANADPAGGWMEIIFQVVGATTAKLSSLKEGDTILDFAGPLGKPTHIENFGRCVCMGGGVGVAPLYPIVCALKAAGNHITTIIGARSKDLIILEDEMRAQSDRLLVTTDDGSCVRKGFVVTVFDELIASGEKFDFAVVIGPVMMMKFTAQKSVAAGIPTVSSLNPIMIDGTGMCGGCRVSIGGETKFACVDGPEFDAAKIDWDLLVRRLGSYVPFEKKALQDHACRLEGVR